MGLGIVVVLATALINPPSSKRLPPLHRAHRFSISSQGGFCWALWSRLWAVTWAGCCASGCWANPDREWRFTISLVHRIPSSVDRNMIYADGAIKLAKPLVNHLADSYTFPEKRG